MILWLKLSVFHLHDFQARRVGIVAGLRDHSASVIADVTWPSLANGEGALAYRDTPPAAGQDGRIASLPLEAATGMGGFIEKTAA